jgi:3-oxoacyl-[acyl-carrier-protein] synthase II
MSADAWHLTAPDPSGAGVVLAIQRASAAAEDPGVVNLHGTGTVFNDAMETAALTSLFGPRGGGKPATTLKGTLGHSLGAAGAIEAVVALASLDQQVVTPTVTGGEEDPGCDLALVTEAQPCDAPLTLSLSSAFGGSNCALLLQRPSTSPLHAPLSPPFRGVFLKKIQVFRP